MQTGIIYVLNSFAMKAPEQSVCTFWDLKFAALIAMHCNNHISFQVNQSNSYMMDWFNGGILASSLNTLADIVLSTNLQLRRMNS